MELYGGKDLRTAATLLTFVKALVKSSNTAHVLTLNVVNIFGFIKFL